MATDLITPDALKRYLLEANVRQPALARSLGLSARSITRFVNGHAPIPLATQIAIYALVHWKSPTFTRFIKNLSSADNQTGKP